MARLLAFNALFFLVPFALYALWLLARRGSIGTASDWPVRVLIGLTCAGALLMATALIIFVQFQGASPGEAYRPAVIRDGQIIPGGFAEPEPEE